MNHWDILLIIALAVVAALSIRSAVRQHRRGGCAGCSGGCAGCARGCNARGGEDRG